MRVTALIVSLILMSPMLFADERNVDFDDQINFATFKTFTIRQGQIASRKPEVNNKIVLNKIEDAIRSELTAKGLKETGTRPDVVVNYRIGAADQREIRSSIAGRRGLITRREAVTFTEGTLVIDLTARDSQDLAWRGTYRDDEGSASKLADKLPGDVKKLFSDYPPKKK